VKYKVKVGDVVSIMPITSFSTGRVGEVMSIIEERVFVNMHDINAINSYPLHKVSLYVK